MCNTIRRCVFHQIAGASPDGVDTLAAYLQVSHANLRLWMDGITPIPDAVFLKAVDLHDMRTLAEIRSFRANVPAFAAMRR